MTAANLWSGFYDKFQVLAGKEGGAQGHHFLQAYCSYEKHTDVFEVRRQAGWASAVNTDAKLRFNEIPGPALIGTLRDVFALAEPVWLSKEERNHLLERGAVCILKAPRYGLWMLSKNGDECFREQFLYLAKQAGVALRCPKDTYPFEFWLHRLFHDLVVNQGELVEKSNSVNKRGESYKAGIIKKVCEASALFCLRLETGSLESFGASPKLAESTRGKRKPGPVTNMDRHKAISDQEQATPDHPGRRISDEAINEQEFTHSTDYRSLNYRGKKYTTTKAQASVIQKLDQARKSGTPELDKAGLGVLASSRLRDAFKRSELWRMLVKVGSKKGTYRLDLPITPSKSK